MWQIISCIVAILGLSITVVTSIIKLNNSIAKLNTTMDNFNAIINKICPRIDDHEIRIVKLEVKNEQ